MRGAVNGPGRPAGAARTCEGQSGRTSRASPALKLPRSVSHREGLAHLGEPDVVAGRVAEGGVDAVGSLLGLLEACGVAAAHGRAGRSAGRAPVATPAGTRRGRPSATGHRYGRSSW